MTTLKKYKTHKKALKAQIKAAKATLKRLERELDAERQNMQHEEVNHLDEYFVYPYGNHAVNDDI